MNRVLQKLLRQAALFALCCHCLVAAVVPTRAGAEEEEGRNALEVGFTHTFQLLRASPSETEAGRSENLWGFVLAYERILIPDRLALVIAKPFHFTQDRFDQHKMNEIFASFDGRVCFVGHTHIPGVFEEDYSFRSPDECDLVYPLGEKMALVNVGSVGQPRDGDPRSCYVIFDLERVSFRRVAYDIELTIRQFGETPLPAYLSRRLREGK